MTLLAQLVQSDPFSSLRVQRVSFLLDSIELFHVGDSVVFGSPLRWVDLFMDGGELNLFGVLVERLEKHGELGGAIEAITDASNVGEASMLSSSPVSLEATGSAANDF